MPEEGYTVPRPPSHLRKAGKTLWRAVCGDWHLEADGDDIVILALACEAADRASQASAELKAHGSLTTHDRFGVVRPHPLVEVERQARAQAAQLVAQIQRGQTSFRRLELATERQARVEARAAQRKDRRGGGRARLNG